MGCTNCSGLQTNCIVGVAGKKIARPSPGADDALAITGTESVSPNLNLNPNSVHGDTTRLVFKL